MATQIGTLGNIPTLTIGGRVFTDLSTLIELTGYCNTNANASLRLYSGSAGYQVTTGKTLTIGACKLSAATSSSNVTFNLGYADNDVGLDSSTAFTSAVWRGGSSSNRIVAFIVGSSGVSTSSVEMGIKVNCIAQKYVAFSGVAGAGGVYITAWGYEA